MSTFYGKCNKCGGSLTNGHVCGPSSAIGRFIEERDNIYRCGYCGFPTDDKGQPLELDNDEAQDYIKEHRDTLTVSTNGHCCAGEWGKK